MALIKDTGKTEYNETLNDGAIKVGGTTAKFVPNINLGKFDDEAWLNINYPDAVLAQKESFVNDKVSIKIGNNTHRFYTISEINHTFEYEIEFESKPLSNTLTFNIDFPEGVDFWYQDTTENDFNALPDGHPFKTTLAQYTAENKRPKNVEGSYAVYFNKQNNKYKTGKLCHIYRPELIDNNGDRIFADISIDKIAKTMTITMDGAWLNNAVYPVVVDPPLGFDEKGGTEFQNGTVYCIAQRVTTDGTGGDTSQMHIIAANEHGSIDYGIKMGMFDTDTNAPGANRETEVEVLVPSGGTAGTAAQEDVTYVSSLAASTEYWVAYNYENGQFITFYDTAGAVENDNSYDASTYAAFPNPYTESFDFVRLHTIWASYAPVGGATFIPKIFISRCIDLMSLCIPAFVIALFCKINISEKVTRRDLINPFKWFK